VRTAGLLVSAVLALDACASPTSGTPDAAAGADTAHCPQGPGREVPELPRLTLPCLTGPGDVEMSRLHGKPEVINMWASWCAPCREEMPTLQNAYERVGDRVEFVGVDVKDSRSSALSFLANHRIDYSQVFDSDGRLPLLLRLQGVPNTLFVDTSGAVVDRVIGRMDDQALVHGLALLGVDRREVRGMR
jgi:thiol-disulfide isomerase/thioredoxin